MDEHIEEADGGPAQEFALPVDLLRLVLKHYLGEGPQDVYELVKAWSGFALVCRSWLEAARTTPLRVNLSDMLELDDDVIDWLCGVTLEELELSPSHYTIDLMRHRPAFIARSGRALRRLLGAQIAAEPEDALIPADFPSLEELDLHADRGDVEQQHFDAGCLASLQALHNLTLTDFWSADLTRLPGTLRTLDLLVYHSAPFALPRGLVLQRLAVAGTTVLIDWRGLCAQVTDYIAISAPVISLLLPSGSRRPGFLDEEMVLRELTLGFVSGKVAHTELSLGELALVTADRQAQHDSEPQPGGHAAAEEEEEQDEAALAAGPQGGQQPPPQQQQQQQAQQQAGAGPLEQGPGGPDWLPRLPPGFTELQHVDHVAVGVYLASCSSRQFGCFFQPDTPEVDEDIGLLDGTRFELVRHTEGEPMQLGFAGELTEQQRELLLSGVPVKRLALEHMSREEVASVINSPAFREASAPTLRLLEGLELEPSLDLSPYTALEELVAYKGKDAELGPRLLPANLVHLEVCASTSPDYPGGSYEAWLQLQPHPPPLDPPLLHFDALRALGHMHQLKELCLTAFHTMDLRQLPPSCTSLLIQDPNYQEWGTRSIPAPYQLSLPRELPHGQPLFEIKFAFTFTATGGGPLWGCWRWVPVVHLDGLLGGATNVSITVSDSTPQEVEEEVDPHFEHWVLTVQCGGRSLHEVMAGVTASPLQAITFDAEEVRFQGAVPPETAGKLDSGGPFISSIKMQEYIEEHWGRHWRVIPLTEPEGDSELEDSSSAGSEGWGEGGKLDEDGFEAKPYHRHRARSFLEGGSEGRGYDEDELSSSSEGSDRGRGDAFTLKRKPQ